MSDPLDELAAPDVISSGSEDFGAFAESRWPGLVRLAFGLTADQRAAEDIAQATLARAYIAWRRVSRADDPDAYLRRILINTSNRRFRRHRVTEQSGDPPETAIAAPPAPVDRIIRRGKGIRLRRAVAAVGCLGLGGIIAAATVLAPPPTPAPARPGWPRLRISAGRGAQDLPVVSQLPLISAATGPMSQADGRWNNVGATGAVTASAVLASGQDWSIRLLFGPGGDCYEFSGISPNNPDMGSCGPISTPDGPETIMALPLSYPAGADNAATGYAVQVSPVTAHLRATLFRRIHPASDTARGKRQKVCRVRRRGVTPAYAPDLA